MADISLKDPLQEIYEEVSPFEYRWKKYEKEAPKMDDDFKWNFLSEIKQPQLEIKGPSVGSLLYALNPQTSELGLKQMESELNQQLQANEMFDKRGEEALKFMENRVQEDIANKKLQNVDAGHANSMISNLVNAYASGNKAAIDVAEQQVIRSMPNAANIINEAKASAEKSLAQKERGRELAAKMPFFFFLKNAGARDAKVKELEQAYKNKEIDLATLNDLIKQAYSIENQQATRAKTYRQAYNTAGASRSVENKNIDIKNKAYNTWKANNPTGDRDTFDSLWEAGVIKHE